MKKILYIVLFLSLTLLTVGCGLDYKSRSKIYYLGDYYKESGRTFKAELDKKNERFIFYYYVDKSSQNNYQMEFLFVLDMILNLYVIIQLKEKCLSMLIRITIK